MTETRQIRVRALTRVEGEGGLTVRLRGDAVEDVQLQIYEPPRFFEALLRGRPLEDAIDITARICGICPVAYQMSSVHALEAALGISVAPEIRRLRRLMYCGEWIESHALHIHLLHAPDFFRMDSGLDLARRFPDEIRRGLELKKRGNALLEVLGGRAIHPVNVAVGGFHRIPPREQLERLIPQFEQGLEDAVAAARWVAGFSFPDGSRSYDLVALNHPDEYPMNEGTVVSLSGVRVQPDAFERTFREHQVSWSTALHSGMVSSPQSPPTVYHVGPLARVSLNRDRLSPTAQRLADETGFETPCHSPWRSIIARSLELIHAYEEALDILRTLPKTYPSRPVFTPCQATGCAVTEAPRGLLYHRYETDDHGQIAAANIIPPTSQNQRQIEEDLIACLPGILEESSDDADAGRACERLIRCYDPCISCSTHFLTVSFQRT